MSLIRPEDWRPQGVDDLEPRAWEALRESDQSVLVTAGAGAGKTEFLAQKAAYLLLTGLCPAPKRILAISFKRDAARNLALRVEKRCTPEQARRFNSFTFDAFAKNLVDRFRAAIPDEFRPPADYHVVMPKRADFSDFLRRKNIHAIDAPQLERLVARTPLPFRNGSLAIQSVRAYWQAQFEDYEDVLLSFAMMNRLALRMLQENPAVRRALHISYPVIFLDEFQDTTFPQYELLQAAFNGADPILTAVGDYKQRIMVWAGAIPEAFDTFVADYQARQVSLICNWRSHEDLVRIQHAIASQIDPEVERPEARAERSVDGDIAAIWQFGTEQEEAEVIATWIAQEVAAGTIEQHDIAILVRQYANDVEGKLTDAFALCGLRLRNLAREVSGISIQDVLGEELTQVLLPLLRLGSSVRSPNDWDTSLQNLQFLEAVDSDDDRALQRQEQRLETFVREARRSMLGKSPDEDAVEMAARHALEFLQEQKLRQAFSEYRRQIDFNRAWGGFLALLQECALGGGNWTDTLDEFEGIGQVVLMTIHKSKGLEFHTVIFYGLDNQTWWSLTPQRPEELKSFFVAFTRAMQRAFFTLCIERGQPVTWLERLLRPAGLERVEGQTIVD
ncbi:UvrD-helicase domain-containing protein [Mesorhizobium sp. PL10]